MTVNQGLGWCQFLYDIDKKVGRYYKSMASIKELMKLCGILHVDNMIQPIRKSENKFTLL